MAKCKVREKGSLFLRTQKIFYRVRRFPGGNPEHDMGWSGSYELYNRSECILGRIPEWDPQGNSKMQMKRDVRISGPNR